MAAFLNKLASKLKSKPGVPTAGKLKEGTVFPEHATLSVVSSIKLSQFAGTSPEQDSVRMRMTDICLFYP